ncbi:MAG: ABC transporter ATP-binding protein [Deltaproteobacteria bacterium]|nr:ABC transporter ATP-binding protein [Deltaproteobacteria bacterium]
MSRPHVNIEGVKKVYGAGRDALEAIREASFAVGQGEFVSLLGPSGCGKSTLLMMVGGLLEPTAGQILVDGGRVTGPRKEVGIVFQSPVLLPWRTVLDNVLFPIEMLRLRRPDYGGRALELLEMTKLEEFRDKLPRELSGGMKQRVSICRALIHNPSLLLMDEPFSALDALTRDQMGLELLRIWEHHKKTVLFVTHSIREAVFLSDRVLVMTQRPAMVTQEIKVELPRPRGLEIQESDEFNRYVAVLRKSIEASHGL